MTEANGTRKEYDRKYYIENKARKLAQRKKRYAENREQELERGKRYAKAHPEVHKKAEKKYYQKHPDRIKAKNDKRNASKEHKDIIREHHLKRSYGITLKQYHEMYNSQEGKCLICHDFQEKLAVDHNHTTGKVRGLICNYCNTALGMMKENIMILESAIIYLKERN